MMPNRYCKNLTLTQPMAMSAHGTAEPGGGVRIPACTSRCALWCQSGQ